MKRVGVLSLLTCLLLGVGTPGMASSTDVPAGFEGMPIWYEYRDQSFNIEGKGTLTNPIVINTPEQLAQVAWLCNEKANSFNGKLIVLGNDIDLNKTVNGQRVQWVPIGMFFSRPFMGHFLGLDAASISSNGLNTAKRHKISGMTITVKGNSNDPDIGLFGYMNGYLGFFDMTDATINVSLRSFNAGIVCGTMGSRKPPLSYDGSRKLKMGCAIEGVSVQGSITCQSFVNNSPVTATGGIVGSCFSSGIFHCSANVTIRTTDVYRTGGICADLEDSNHPTIIDCVANADIEATYNTLDKMWVGGIAARMGRTATIEACVTTGTLKVTKDQATDQVYLGGMVGQMRGGTIRSCANMAGLTGECTLGGIVGRQEQDNNALVECCVNSGYIDCEGNKPESTFAGGICGETVSYLEREHVTRCLFLGTAMDNVDRPQGMLSAIVAKGSEHVKSNVTYCYYDKNMYHGSTIGKANSNALQPLTTVVLTDGNETSVPFLNIDESQDYGFRLQKGRYPIIYDNRKPDAFIQDIKDNKADGLNDLARLLFTTEGRNEANTVSLPGLLLASMPINMNNGDCAYDFVSHLTAPLQSEVWTEAANAGRSVSLTASTTIPQSPSIRVKDNTVYAYQLGNCQLTMNGKVKTKTAVLTRPWVMDLERPILLNVSVDEGYNLLETATEFAGGSGSFDDPYLVKGPFQFLLAIKNNKQGEYYRQVGDITFSRQLLTQHTLSYGQEPWGLVYNHADSVWRAHYDGDGYFVRGIFIKANNTRQRAAYHGLFSIIAPTGTVENLGLRDCFISADATPYDNVYGLLAGRVEGTVRNCLVQGANASGLRCGGICGHVAQGGVVEDCVSAVIQYHYLLDLFTPFVAYDNAGNQGTLRNCLYVTPVPYSSNKVATSDIAIVKDCYWLKGYEIADNGQTLDEIGAALTQRSTWSWTRGYFPMLKTFADTETGILLSTPLRSDEDYAYDSSLRQANNYLLGLTTQLQFEPGSATWTTVNSYHGNHFIEADGDMGIVAPTAAMDPLGKLVTISHIIGPIEYLCANMGNVFNFIPLHTAQSNVKPGITITDVHARHACLDAFDANHDGNLSLSELKAVTNEQTLTAFQTATARQMVSFPEFRYFKSVTHLSTQLNGLSLLKDIRLPYALQTVGREAFKDCSSLTTVTMPSKLATVEPGAFYLSQVENILVDPFNEHFVSRGGILFTRDNELVACPNGRHAEELTISGDLSSIASGAVYKMPGMKRLFLESSDYSTVAELADGGIVSDDGSMPDVYINDATWDQTLFEEYLADPSWQAFVAADKLHRYFPLTVSPDLVATIDGHQRYLASMFIGFDTQLPDGMTACIATEADMTTHQTRMLGKGRLVPARSPVLITAVQPGLYHLVPYDEELEMWPVYENRLQGTGRDGMPLGQQSSAQGFICTLSKPDGKQQPGFYHDQRRRMPPFSTYLTFNTTGMDPEQARDTHYDILFEATDDKNVADGDFLFNVHSVSAIDLYSATIASYQGQGGHVTIPGSLTITTSDESQLTVPVENLAPAAFIHSKGDILSLNFLECDRLQDLTVNRNSMANPFFGLPRSTMVYMPDAHGHTAASGEVNIVIGTYCDQLLISDDCCFEPPYDFTTAKATYSRTFSARQNADGTWSSMAYPVCIPFFAELASSADDPRFKKVAVFSLNHVDRDKREVVFNNDFPVLSSGWPYVVVVKEGELTITSDMSQLVNHQAGPIEVKARPVSRDIDVFGASGDVVDQVSWCGTYQEVSNDESVSRGIYVMQSDGTFRRISNRSAQYQSVTVKPFRSFLETLGVLTRNAYTIKYQYQEQGEDDYPVTDFPTNDYNDESDMPPYDDETAIGDAVRQHHPAATADSQPIYDLQGRRVANGECSMSNGPRNATLPKGECSIKKGLYITRGKKVIVK